MSMEADSERITRKAMGLFFMLFLGFGAVLGGLAAVFYQSEINTIEQAIGGKEIGRVELQSLALEEAFVHVAGDILFLAQQTELVAFLDGGDVSEVREDIEEEFAALARAKRVYDQIRLIGTDGMERIRVNDNNGHPAAVGQRDLQNKADRYYFREAMALERGGISVSPLDLNVEQCEIERPFKPVIRFGTPIYDRHGIKSGVVVLNYKAQTMLSRLLEIGRASDGEIHLINDGGFWLLGPDKSREWGFMLPDRGQETFARDYPAEWKQMSELSRGQIRTANGMFTFRHIYPLREVMRTLADDERQDMDGAGTLEGYSWVLVSHVDADRMRAYGTSLVLRLFGYGAAVFVVVSLGAWALAVAVTRRRLYQAQLLRLALHDTLTELPNRKLFFAKLDVCLEHAQRHGRKAGLLYVDLDGFKHVNDSMGHQAGDELLRQVARTLEGCCRKSDTVARLGGDEFAVVLFETSGEDGVRRAGMKIVEAMEQPFKLKAGTARIGASVGAAVYPDHGRDPETLVKRADSAMYQAKARGKSFCVVYSPSLEDA